MPSEFDPIRDGPWTITNPWVEAAGDDWIPESKLSGCTTANYAALILAMISLFVSCVALCGSDHGRHVVVVSENGEDKFITV